MSVNKDRPHVLVLPEDDANRQLADGFHLEVDWNRQRQMQVLPVAGGWQEVLHGFQTDHIRDMDRYQDRHLVLLIDFDGQGERLNQAMKIVPDHLTERVFILGVWTEPEDLDLGPFETIGTAMAKNCREGTNTTWGHGLLRHNATELDRLYQRVRPILFPSD